MKSHFLEKLCSKKHHVRMSQAVVLRVVVLTAGTVTVQPCCSLNVRAYTGVPAVQGTWKTAGVGRGRQRGRETVFVHCTVTTHMILTAATNLCSCC